MSYSQVHAWPSLLRMCHNALLLRPSGSAYRRLASLAVPHHWSCCVPVPCATAPEFCFELHGSPTRVTNPCALHIYVQCLGDVPLGALLVQGYTQKEAHEECISHHWYKPKEGGARLVSWCWFPSRSWPLHLARLASSLKSGCGCRWIPRRPTSAQAHLFSPCSPAPHIVLCLYLPLVFDSRWHCPHQCWMPRRVHWREPCPSLWTRCNPSPPIARVLLPLKHLQSFVC